MSHIPVLLHEAIDGLDIKKGDVFVDGTLGGGGHSLEVLKRFGKGVVMIAIDLDPEAIKRGKKLLSPLNPEVRLIEDNFSNIKQIITKLKLKKVNKILLDLGFSTFELEESGRGFSFQRDEPLIMTYKEKPGELDLRAVDILNAWQEKNIAEILKNYGEEQFSWKIAKAIVARREVKPIVSTYELVQIIKVATPKWYQHRKLHPATKTFQALRIAVNNEIEMLKTGIRDGFEILSKNGRMAVISFHSLEDRLVKNFFRNYEKEGLGKLVTKKPIIASREEVLQNPKSRSAKLRIIKKI
jgi:16S rRNA (cytosine1402-N4)-methyltransferase